MKQLKIYNYSVEHSKWLTSPDNTKEDTLPAKLNVVTLNVLVPYPYLSWIQRNQERYLYQLDLLKQTNADFIGLNEVNHFYLELLLKQQWVRDKYYVSDISQEETSSVDTIGQKHGTVLLMKYRPTAMHFDTITVEYRDSKPVIAEYKTSGKAICAVHLTAYKEYPHIREQQLQQIIKFMDTGLQCKDYLIMGDLNIHLDSENATLAKLTLRDLWTEANGEKDPGYTFDGTENSLIKMIYCRMESRRMRLDRIMVSAQSQWKAKEMKIIANKAMYQDSYWDWLYPSDHYGLEAQLSL